MHKLSALGVTKAVKPGRYADGGGLYLQVGPTGARAWLFRFTLGGRAREMGLGPVGAVSLAEARAKAAACRKLLVEKRDPLEARKAEEARATLARGATFRAMATEYVQAHEAGWRNPKHRQQWRNTLAEACEVLGELPVREIDTHAVLRVVEPMWRAKPETASRLRGRIEAVLDFAAVRGVRSGENPARWKGHLANLLPARAKIARVEHHAALPWREIGAFMAALRARETISASGLAFLILTAARTGEVIGATWGEIDLEGAVWTVPAERMKAGVEHRVPLSGAAVEVLRRLPREVEWVFPGGRKGKPLSNMAFLALLRDMGRGDLTAHGFRSTFRDWCSDATNVAGEIAEAALAHTNKNKVEAAYRRGDLFEKRRWLMTEWAEFCGRAEPAGGKVVPMRARGN